MPPGYTPILRTARTKSATPIMGSSVTTTTIETTQPGDSHPTHHQRDRTIAIGLLYGLAAYGTWGTVVPLYFKWVYSLFTTATAKAALELAAHRVLWGLPFLLIIIHMRGRWKDLLRVFQDRSILTGQLLSTLLISVNWLAFVYGLITDRLAEVSLGYFINPLVSIALGMIFLSERARPMQWLAIILAAIGVASYTILNSGLPWLALSVAFSFGFYGLIRKQSAVDGLIGLGSEMLMLFPIAAGYIAYVMFTGQGMAADLSPSAAALILAGPVTVLPLIWFTNAARRLRLSTIGFLQYMAPTGQLLLAIFLFGEDFGIPRAIGFSMIWTALAIYSTESVLWHRNARAATRRALLLGEKRECEPRG